MRIWISIGLMCNNSSGERLLADGCSRVPFSPFIDLRWWWTCKLSFVSVTRPCLLFCSHTLRTELAHISEKSTVILEKYYNLIKHEKRDKPTGTRWVGWSLCYSPCFKFFLKIYSTNLLKKTRGKFRRQTRRRTPILKNDLTKGRPLYNGKLKQGGKRACSIFPGFRPLLPLRSLLPHPIN